jgi:exosortase/archaeosortase family protein
VDSLIKNPFYRFVVLSTICYLAWFVCYDLWLSKNGLLDYCLGKSTTYLVSVLLNIGGYKISYTESNGLFYFYNHGNRLLQMVPACNGQVLYPLFIGFIIATPGLLLDKARFCTIGSLVIFIINTIRVIGLILLKIHAPEYLAFNHKYSFTVFVYACIFGMWVIWINYFVPKVKNKKNVR